MFSVGWWGRHRLREVQFHASWPRTVLPGTSWYARCQGHSCRAKRNRHASRWRWRVRRTFKNFNKLYVSVTSIGRVQSLPCAVHCTASGLNFSDVRQCGLFMYHNDDLNTIYYPDHLKPVCFFQMMTLSPRPPLPPWLHDLNTDQVAFDVKPRIKSSIRQRISPSQAPPPPVSCLSAQFKLFFFFFAILI